MKDISYYHGSPQNRIKILRPHLDERTGKFGIFISDNPILPMLFSLIEDKSKANISYVTNGERFEGGHVKCDHLHEVGYIYRIKPVQDIEYIQPFEFHIKGQEEIIDCVRITIDQVKNIGWEIL